MEVTIYWTDFAKEELHSIYNFTRIKNSAEFSKKIIKKIIDSIIILKSFPELGQIETFLQDKKQSFRFIIQDNYKIIYWFNKPNNRIEIIDIFDCRQNPILLNRIK